MESALPPVNYRPNKLLRFWRKLLWLFTVYLRPRHEAVVHTANGILSYDSKDKKTGRNLYIQRQFEYDFMHETVRFLKSIGSLNKTNGGTLLDVGGYIGMSSTAFLLDNLFAKSIIFEPNPDSFHLLKKNIALNKLIDRTTAFNTALSDSAGELLFELSDDNFGDHRIRSSAGSNENKFNESNRKIITIKANTLDRMITDNTIPDADNIKLVWMDIQGHEGRFLKGARSFLSTYNRVPVVMEFWPYAMNKSGQDKKEFLTMIYNLFNTFYLLSGSSYVKHKIHDLKKYYEQYESSSNPSAGAELILLNE